MVKCLNKAQLCAILVERSVFYGSRTIKKVDRWFRKNHNEITGHNERGARVVVGKAVAELQRYRDEKAKSLMRLSREELVRMIKHKSAVELQRRYGVDRIPEKELPPIELKEERAIVISNKELSEWRRQSARRKKKVYKNVKKAAKPVRKRLTKRTAQRGTLNYVKQIMAYNKQMATVRNVAGLEG
jgi:hypothetical protein